MTSASSASPGAWGTTNSATRIELEAGLLCQVFGASKVRPSPDTTASTTAITYEKNIVGMPPSSPERIGFVCDNPPHLTRAVWLIGAIFLIIPAADGGA